MFPRAITMHYLGYNVRLRIVWKQKQMDRIIKIKVLVGVKNLIL